MNVYMFLEQVRMLDELIDAKNAERQRLLEIVTNVVPQVSDMPRGGGVSDRVGNAAVKLVTLAEETDRIIDEYIDRRQEVIEILETLPPNEYAVLHRKYIQYMRLGEIAEEMDRSIMQVWRYKQAGIERLAKMLAQK